MSADELLNEQLENFRWNVFALRNNLGLSQIDLGATAGVSHVVVSRIENDERPGVTLTTALLLANALKADLNTMFNDRYEVGAITRHSGMMGTMERRLRA